MRQKTMLYKATKAIYEELRSTGSRVVISALLPGPVDTEFNSVAGVKSFGIPSENEAYVADYAIERLFMRRSADNPPALPIAGGRGRLKICSDKIPSQDGKNVTGAEEQNKDIM